MLTLPQPCLDRWQEKAENLQPFKNRYTRHQQSAYSVFLRVEIDLSLPADSALHLCIASTKYQSYLSPVPGDIFLDNI